MHELPLKGQLLTSRRGCHFSGFYELYIIFVRTWFHECFSNFYNVIMARNKNHVYNCHLKISGFWELYCALQFSRKNTQNTENHSLNAAVATPSFTLYAIYASKFNKCDNLQSKCKAAIVLCLNDPYEPLYRNPLYFYSAPNCWTNQPNCEKSFYLRPKESLDYGTGKLVQLSTKLTHTQQS